MYKQTQLDAIVLLTPRDSRLYYVSIVDLIHVCILQCTGYTCSLQSDMTHVHVHIKRFVNVFICLAGNE